MKGYLILVSLVAAAGGFLFGFDTSVISGAIEFLEKVFQLTQIEKGWTVSCIILGCMVGCIVVGPLSGKYGRKKLLIFTALLFLVSSLGCALATQYYVFIINRIVAGLAVGSASMLAPIYIAEISPAKHRGKLVALNVFAIFLGQFTAFFSNFLLRDVGGVDNWRWMIGIQVVPSAVLLVFLFFIPESPRWLVEKNQRSKALKTLLKLGDNRNANADLEEIIHSVEETYQGKLKDLFIPRMFKLLLIGIMIGIFQQITGINVIMYYAPTIFRFAGFGTDSALLQTVLMGIVNMVFAVASMFFVDKVGRRPLMIIGSAGMGLCLLALSVIFIYQDIHRFFVLGSIMGFLAFFGFSLGPVVWVIISEIFPNKLRSYAVAITVFFIWASNFIVSLSFPYLLANLGGYSFFIFSFMCFLCVLFVVKYLRETKGKTLERIEYEVTEA